MKPFIKLAVRALSASKTLRFASCFKDYSTLGVRYRDLQARVYKQGTPRAVLNFEFLVCKRVLVNPITHEQRVLQTF